MTPLVLQPTNDLTQFIADVRRVHGLHTYDTDRNAFDPETRTAFPDKISPLV